jgi:thiol:disulfide interchange protein DsbD
MSVAIDLNLKPQEPASGLPMGWNQRLDQSFKKALDQNIAWAFLIVFIAGFLTSLTPCIFPMIPITLTVLGTRRDISTFQRFKLSLSYVLGIALTYSTLGMIVASTGALFGAFLGQPAVVVALAAVFVLMGFAMLGYFEIALPPKIQTFLSPKAGNAGWLEAAGSGLLAGLIASPCVGPVLVSVLTFVAQTKNVLLGFSLLFVFALGMGQLFLILGTSTKFVDRMPRSGSWMQGIQKLFAVCFFALAAWYVSPLLSSALLDGLLAVLLTASTVILGLFRRGLPKGGWRILYRTALLGVFFCGIYFGAQSFQQMFGHVSSGELPTSKLPWQPYSKAAMDAAFREHRPILIDFWADWCVACKELEVGPYSNAEVQSLSQQFLLVKFNATKPSAEFEELKKQYGIVGLPYVGFYDVSGHFRPDLTLTGFERTELFLQRMRQALKSHSQ